MRLAIVCQLMNKPEGVSCIELASAIDPDIPKSTCSQHFQILRAAGLIHSRRRGVEHSNRLRLDELDARFPGLVASVVNAFEAERIRRGSARRPQEKV
ncbi:MAG: helix-turn-helix domain-containing protein [Tepidisphaeraceae bacterium]